MFLGLRTIIYPSPDIDAAKAWFTGLLGFELALDPNGSVDDGPVTYWGVPDCDEARARLLDAGATPRHPVRDVGDSIRVATVVEPSGSIIGIIENPHFQLPDGPASPGPGR